MYHLSDKDLDRLSKEAAEKYDVESTTSGWEAVEDQLNKELPPNTDDRRRRRFLFFLLFFVLFCGTGLTLMLDNSGSLTKVSAGNSDLHESINKPQAENEMPGSNETISGTSRKTEKPTSQNNNNSRDDKELTSTGKNNKDRVSNERNSTDEGTVTTADKQSISVPEGNSIKEKKQTRPSTKPIRRPLANNESFATDLPITKGKERQPSKQQRLITSSDVQNNVKSHIATSPRPQERRRNLQSAGDLKPSDVGSIIPLSAVPDVQKGLESYSKKPQTALHDLAPMHATKTAASNKNKDEAVTRGLQVGLTYAPDYSNVKFTHRDKVGFNAGVTIGYRFNRRWSVNTGVIFTKKNYTAHGKDYHPPKDYWTYNVYLNTVIANCNMLDIPLNVRYDFISNRKNHAFLSTGFSTYFMNKETYDYHFTYNGVYGREERTYDEKTKHWFSILNISTGYERSEQVKFT